MKHFLQPQAGGVWVCAQWEPNFPPSILKICCSAKELNKVFSVLSQCLVPHRSLSLASMSMLILT